MTHYLFPEANYLANQEKFVIVTIGPVYLPSSKFIWPVVAMI
jgi:hypothetical protein